MRVITGTARGRKLQAPDGMDTRPTTDLVKEAVFSVIHFIVPCANVLDLFAGSGQMGIEALSRGANKAVFLDSSRKALDVIKQNLQNTGFVKQAKVLSGDAESFLTNAVEKYDIIFLDPPYNQGYPEKLLPLLGKPLSENGVILYEHDRKEELPEETDDLILKKRYRYGRTMISSYVRKKDEL